MTTLGPVNIKSERSAVTEGNACGAPEMRPGKAQGETFGEFK